MLDDQRSETSNGDIALVEQSTHHTVSYLNVFRHVWVMCLCEFAVFTMTFS